LDPVTVDYTLGSTKHVTTQCIGVRTEVIHPYHHRLEQTEQ